MIRRFNHKDLPKEMEECLDGYWVTYEDYNLRELSHNKEMEKSYNRYCEEIQKYQYLKSENKTVDNLRTAVIIMSAIIFGGLMSFLFTWI